MDYYLNEYSLQGQFSNEDEFLKSIRENTIPVIKKIGEEDGSILYKKDTFWSLNVCEGRCLQDIQYSKRKRSPEIAILKQFIQKNIIAKPYCCWDNVDYGLLYKVDGGKEQLIEEERNSFILAIDTEGKIVSFEHPDYKANLLHFLLKDDEKCYDLEIDNIWNSSWWKLPPAKVQSWMISAKYRVEVRSREFEHHAPHFHVLCSDYAAVFSLKDCGILAKSEKLPGGMIKEVNEWFEEHKDMLRAAWVALHGNRIMEW